MNKKIVVLYSAGESSALVAVEAVRKYGRENVILLNHDICGYTEDMDIKRFKYEVAEYLQMEIEYANMEGFDENDHFDVCMKEKAFKGKNNYELCTNRLKTKPFKVWLKENYPVQPGEIRQDVVFCYGFDPDEPKRMERRRRIMKSMGYETEFPLAEWDRTIQRIEDIGIEKPRTYKLFKHANCVGCIKAGRLHFYVVYCHYPHIWKKALKAEETIGYSIIKGVYLKELEEKFRIMKALGIEATEHVVPQRFWADVRRKLKAA